MLKCREVVNRADQLLDGDLSRGQRFAVKMHLLMCHHCRRYVRQLRFLLRAIPFRPGQRCRSGAGDGAYSHPPSLTIVRFLMTTAPAKLP